MKKWFTRLKLSRQIAVVCGVFLLIPVLTLYYTTMRSARETAIEAKIQEAETSRDRFMAEAERVAELCNMSTQVFLNTPALTEHLSALTAGREPDALALLEFYREDLASLKKIIISNPDLYQIRVYSTVSGIHEMMPILYGAERMERLSWADKELPSGSWVFDFDDTLFPNQPATPHILSLVTDITSEYGKVGVLETSVRMDEVMPELFSGDEASWTVLLSENGEVLAGTTYVEAEELPHIPLSETPVRTRLDGRRTLTTRAFIQGSDCVYLQVTDLSDIYAASRWQALWLFIAFAAAFALMTAVVSRLIRRMLRGFYGAFDGIRAFAAGDMDATVEVTGKGEIADFAREAGGLLEMLRKTLRDNLEREAQIQRAETKALQNQINAHFIYNVLEAIKMMAEIDEKYEIADAVTTLGKLLRYSMKLEGGNVELSRELEYIRNYIDLMNLRFDYVITLYMDIPEELMGQKIPKISLQPIVENAVVHGAAALAADSTISLRGEIDRERGRCTISIRDEGVGMDEGALERLKRQIAGLEPTSSGSGNGIGLKNVHDRIRLSFGEEYGLRVESKPGVGTTVMVDLPYREPEKVEGGQT